MGAFKAASQIIHTGRTVVEVPDEDMKVVEMNYQGRDVWAASILGRRSVVFLSEQDKANLRVAMKAGNKAVYEFLKKVVK